MTKRPSYADLLIAANRESRGDILRRLETIDNPSYAELLATHILRASRAKELPTIPAIDIEEPEP